MSNNTTLIENRATQFYEYVVVFIVIFFAGNASVFARSFETWNNIFGLVLPVVAIGALGLIKGVQFNHRYLLLMIGYLIYTVASTIKFGEIHPHFFGINVIKFTLAYVIISSLRLRFFKMYEEILFYLAIIALFFWILHNTIPSTFVELLRNFEFSTQGITRGSTDFNAIVYTVSNYDIVPDHLAQFGSLQLFRNSGFAWEPGAFSVYLSIGILFNLLRKKFQLKNNKHLWVFIIALVTTFSTTGYSLLILLIFFYIYNQKFSNVFWLFPVVLIITIYLFTLPFMADKIEEKSEFNTEQLIYNSIKHNVQYTPQRFQSLKIDFIDFLNHPIIGYGGQQEARWTVQLGAQIATISGIGKVMGQFGIVGIIFFLLSIWKSSRKIIIIYNARGALFISVFILMISISYTIFTLFYACIWLFYLSSFYKTEVIREFLRQRLLNSTNG